MVGVRSGKSSEVTGVGRRLKKAREKRRISLTQASEDLHISVKQLSALESEDYSVFSAEIYVRGAYSAYAEYLGIDTRSTSRAFFRALTSVREHVPLILHTPESLLSRLMNPRIIFIASGVFLAFLVAGYIAWQLQSFWRLPHLVLTSPVSHVIQGSHVTLEGKAEALSRLQINGEAALLDADASFSVPLILHPGINRVVIEVINAAGRVNRQELSLLRT